MTIATHAGAGSKPSSPAYGASRTPRRIVCCRATCQQVAVRRDAATAGGAAAPEAIAEKFLTRI